jgi:membrane protease subunit HflC
MNKSSYLLVFAALIVGIAFNSFFIVDEKEKAIVFQFGEAVRTDIDVGFSFKLPIILVSSALNTSDLFFFSF